MDDAELSAVDDLFPRGTGFALRNFYGSLESYEHASVALSETLSAREEVSLGEQIRAKDHRDQCLKLVYTTGEAALDRLRVTIG